MSACFRILFKQSNVVDNAGTVLGWNSERKITLYHDIVLSAATVRPIKTKLTEILD